MSLPDRSNHYSFNEYLEWRKDVDYYRDDPFARAALRSFAGDAWPVADSAARELSTKASGRWRDLADAIAAPEKRPYMSHYDGHGRRIDRIVRPCETEIMEREIFGEALFSEKTPPWVKLIKMYLVYQNGEACVACPMTCTEGMVELLRKFADTPELKSILAHTAEGIGGEYAIGAQYLSEIQGGSDVPSNVLEAVDEGGAWRLYGTKFFCSATHADYAVVTAKPTGAGKVALFIVPSWLPGDRERERRNGHTIDRIKWKMGTSELTTAEITFNGALAYPVGPLERGVANVVGIVLTCSRLTVGLSAAAFMTRAVREAKQYARFRTAFGLTIGDFPMLAGQIESIDRTAKRTTAGAFRLYRDFLALEGGLKGGLVTDEPDDLKRRRFAVRELIMLQKITSSYDAVDVIRTAMSVFGGHGVIEDFSCLPRLYRDSAVNELWEGPRNVLLTQMHRDFQRASEWYRADDFVRDAIGEYDEALQKDLARELADCVAHPNLFAMDAKTAEVCERWGSLCHRLYHAYQECALREVETGAGITAG
jgi:alkylation response protein AidB-like acyl-CoA dehydrogenase